MDGWRPLQQLKRFESARPCLLVSRGSGRLERWSFSGLMYTIRRVVVVAMETLEDRRRSNGWGSLSLSLAEYTQLTTTTTTSAVAVPVPRHETGDSMQVLNGSGRYTGNEGSDGDE